MLPHCHCYYTFIPNALFMRIKQVELNNIRRQRKVKDDTVSPNNSSEEKSLKKDMQRLTLCKFLPNPDRRAIRNDELHYDLNLSTL